MLRTHTCGELTDRDMGKRAILCGWVSSRRDHGSLIFIDLRDGYGITQIVFDPAKGEDVHKAGEGLRAEFVVMIEGVVEKRPAGTQNARIPTGLIEIRVERINILNKAATPPLK